MIKNGIEILEFSPEESEKVYQQKAESRELIIKKKAMKEAKKEARKKLVKQNNINNESNYDDKNNNENNTHNFSGIFYKRGKDNYSKKNYYERETFYKNKDSFYNDNYNYNDYNDSYIGVNSYKNLRRDYINDRYNKNTKHRRNNNFYERGRPNPIFRGFRGRRGGY